MARLPFALIALLLLVALAPAPVAAIDKMALDYEHMSDLTMDTFEGTALDFNPYENDRCIVAAVFNIPAHSQVDFTLYDYGQTIPGSLNVSDETFNRVFRWSLGNESIEWGRLKVLNQVGGEFYLRTWTDSVYNGTVSSRTYAGLSEFYRGPTGIAYAPLNAAISRISVTASEPIEVQIYTVPVATFYDAAIAQTEQVVGFTDTLLAMGAGALTVSTFAWGIFSKIFIQNFYALIALYVSITGAVAVTTKRDIFKALETWIGYQVSLLEFMIKTVEGIVSIVTSIINALKPL